MVAARHCKVVVRWLQTEAARTATIGYATVAEEYNDHGVCDQHLRKLYKGKD